MERSKAAIERTSRPDKGSVIGDSLRYIAEKRDHAVREIVKKGLHYKGE